MTAKLIRYIGFSLYNCLEITVQRVYKTWKTQGISFVPNLLITMVVCLSGCAGEEG